MSWREDYSSLQKNRQLSLFTAIKLRDLKANGQFKPKAFAKKHALRNKFNKRSLQSKKFTFWQRIAKKFQEFRNTYLVNLALVPCICTYKFPKSSTSSTSIGTIILARIYHNLNEALGHRKSDFDFWLIAYTYYLAIRKKGLRSYLNKSRRQISDIWEFLSSISLNK
jgi:hypothetical protein